MFLSTALGKLIGRGRTVVAPALCAAAGGAALMFASPASAQVTTWPVDMPRTLSQFSSTQLNQLFLFENTPDKSAQGEGFVTGSFVYENFHHFSTERYQVQAEYAFTDQFAIGGFIPIIHNDIPGNSSTGFGDITPYVHVKLDQVVPHDIVDLSFQFDVVLPTGDKGDIRDSGRLGVRPWLQAYKDFGAVGPGHFGAYGEAGFTLTDLSDFRWGFALQYEYEKTFYGLLEFYNQMAGNLAKPIVVLTPGGAVRSGPFEFALGFPIGLNNASPTFGVIVKATYGW
jgi:hypothetical protein